MAARPYPVVIMLTSFDVGGTERQTVELVRGLDPHRFRVHVACFHKRGALLSRVPESATITAFPLHGFRRPQAIRQWSRFARWCRSIEARVVHTCDLYANLFGLTAAALAGVPVRIGSRRELITGDKTRLQLAGQRLAYRTAHVVVANTGAAIEQLAREGVGRDRVRLIPNGVDIAAYVTTPPRQARRRVVVVANLRAEKGHDVLLEAAPHILDAHADAEILIAGTGPMASALKAHAAALGLSGRVAFLGQCDHVPELLGESDIAVLPSRSEALPNAVIEAMAAGLPVVASEVGGIPDLVTPGVTGLLVPPGDHGALARAVVSLMDRPAYATALGRAGRLCVERDYAMARMVASVERLYLDGIERHEPSSAMSIVEA